MSDSDEAYHKFLKEVCGDKTPETYLDENDDNIFLIACKMENIPVVKYMVGTLPDKLLTAINSAEDNCYHIATCIGNLELLKYLIKESGLKGINAFNIMDMNILLIACEEGHLNIVKYLVEEVKMDISYEDDDGSNGYIFAFEHSHVNVMKYIELEHNKHVAEEDKITDWYKFIKNKLKNDPYKYSASYNDVKMMKYFDDHHSKYFDVKNIDGCDDLYLYAAEEGYYEVMQYLEKRHNWDPYVTNKHGDGAYVIGLFNSNLDVINYVENNKECYTSKGIIGRKWNKLVKRYNCPYITSINLEYIKFMIYLDTNYECYNFLKDSNNPYFEAVKNRKQEAITYLEATHGCGVNTVDKNGYNCYLKSIRNNDLETVKFIDSRNDTNVSNRENYGNDALLLAVKYNYLTMVKYLIENRKWDLSVKNNYGEDIYSIAKNNNASHALSHYLEGKKLYGYFRPIQKIEYNKKCLICLDNFDKSDILCKCHKSHIIHIDCYIEYLNENNIEKKSEFQCVYCKDNMLNSSYKYSELVDCEEESDESEVKVDNDIIKELEKGIDTKEIKKKN